MKAAIIQPPYYTDYSRSDECFEFEMKMLDECDKSLDLIVLPEMADIPCLAHNTEERLASIKKYNKPLLDKASETARRCSAHVFVNARYKSGEKYINTTYAYDKNGEIRGLYFKEHPTNGEVANPDQETGYSFEHTTPTIVEMDGIRYAFLTCYDFYFYENFANIARYTPDIIVGCSHQRTDTHSSLELMSAFLAYNTNAYVVRSSVSMGEDSPVGGASLVASPTGKILLDMYSRTGMETVEFDPHEKYYKPAGFGNPPSAHHEYIEKGRRPWKYRPSGSAITIPESVMGYPRLCAHRGFSATLPENTMPAFGAAVAMGVEEIEFDLWPTTDGAIVSSHDWVLERVSTGEGIIYKHSFDELRALDFGIKYGEKFKGLKIPTFEEILKKFACHVIMNIHVKSAWDEYPVDIIKEIVSLIRKYDCERYVYFMLDRDSNIRQFKEYAPDIPVCVGHDPARPFEIVDRAIALGCQKVQFFKPHINKEMIDKAHAHGIICNVYWADTEEEAKQFLEMGCDTILTNEYGIVSNVLK